MDQESIFSVPPTSVLELRDLLKSCPIPSLDVLDKNALMTLMTGFKIIVEAFQEESEETHGNLAIEWLRLYLRARSIVAISESKLFLFMKTTPIVITYILGWFQHGPSDSPAFLNELLPLTLKLVRLTDAAWLRELPKYDLGLILILWPTLDKAESYSFQLYTLHLIVLLLQNLSSESQYNVVSDMVTDEPDELKYVLLDLIKMRTSDTEKFNKYSRRVLNLHNECHKSTAQIFSFQCKAIYLGKHLKFIKLANDDRFWFDINLKCPTISFEGRTYVRKYKKHRKVDASLKIAKISIGTKKVIIQFKAAEINGLLLEDFQNVELVYIDLTNTDLKRFGDSLRAHELGKNLIVPKGDYCFGERFDNLNEQNSPKKTSNRLQPKVQKVQPLKKTPLDYFREEIDAAAAIAAQAAQPTDEYDDIEVSDAEPCQSYKNFETHPPRLFANLTTYQTSKGIKKRAAANVNNSEPTSRKKQRKSTDSLHTGATSSKLVQKQLTSKPETSIENELETNQSNANAEPSPTLSLSHKTADKSIKGTQFSFEFSAADSAEIADAGNKTSLQGAHKCDQHNTPMPSTSRPLEINRLRSEVEASSEDDDESLLELQKKIKLNSNRSQENSQFGINFALKSTAKISTAPKVNSRFLQEKQNNRNDTKAVEKPDDEDDEFQAIKEKFERFRATCLNENNSTDLKMQLQESSVVHPNSYVETNSRGDVYDDISSKILEVSVGTNSMSTVHTNSDTLAEAKGPENALIYCQRSDNESSSDEENDFFFRQPKQNDRNSKLSKQFSKSGTTENIPMKLPDSSIEKSEFDTITISSDESNDKNHSEAIGKLKFELQPMERAVTEINSNEIKSDTSINDVFSKLKSEENSMNSFLQNNEKTPVAVSQSTSSLASRKQALSRTNSISDSGSSCSQTPTQLTNFKELTPTNSTGKIYPCNRPLITNPRRLLSELDATDSDTSAGEYTEIVMIARTKKRRHTVYESMPRKDIFSMLVDNIEDVAPNIAEYLHY